MNVDNRALKVELVSVHSSSTPLCSSAEVLLAALIADPAFRLKDKRLQFKGKFACEYAYSDLFKTDGMLGVHHVFNFSSDADLTEDNCEKFSEMLKAFRKNLYTLDADRIETLWDDVSFRYCRLAYPIILNTENQMRRLIAQFMLKNLGAKWMEISAPKEVRDQLGKAKRGADSSDPLHEVDFDTLVDYLLKPYASETTEAMHKHIRSLSPESIEQAKESIDKLKAMVPQSNWSRYFSQIVECEDSLLRSKWTDLYLLRCKVAHNTYLTSNEYQSVIKLSGELDKIITSAIAKLGQVHVSDEAAAELESMATQVTEDASSNGPINANNLFKESYSAYGLKQHLRVEINRTRDLLRAVSLKLGEPLPVEARLFDLQRIALRIAAITLEENRLIDKALDYIGARGVEYPADSMVEAIRDLKQLRIDVASRHQIEASDEKRQRRLRFEHSVSISKQKEVDERGSSASQA